MLPRRAFRTVIHSADFVAWRYRNDRDVILALFLCRIDAHQTGIEGTSKSADLPQLRQNVQRIFDWVANRNRMRGLPEGQGANYREQ
jgi:hypothetical protein